jgi:hypothetical protein
LKYQTKPEFPVNTPGGIAGKDEIQIPPLLQPSESSERFSLSP